MWTYEELEEMISVKIERYKAMNKLMEATSESSAYGMGLVDSLQSLLSDLQIDEEDEE